MKSLSYLNKYFYKYRWRLIFGIVFIALNNYFGAKMPVLLKEATDALFDSSSHAGKSLFQNPVFIIALTYVAFSVISGFFLFLTRQTIIIMSRHIEYDLKNEIYNKYQQLHFGFFKKHRTGDLMNRISEDVSQVRQYLGPGIMYTANLAIMFPLVAYQMYKLSPQLTLFALLPLPVMTILIYFVSNKMNRLSKEVQQEQSNLNTLAQETFSGMRVIKAYLQEKHNNKRFRDSSGEYLKRQMKLVKTNALFMPTIMLLIGASSMLSIYVGGTMFLNKEIKDPGVILAFIGFVYKMTWPFASVGWVTSIIQRASASQTRINEFLQTTPEIVSTPNAEKVEFESLKFDHVNFKYRPDLPMALENINFELKKGQVLGIIGRTGSGKSTILQLLLRQVDPSSGTISVNNKSLPSIDLAHFRSNCAVVPQDVFLFSDTIKQNILFGSEVEVSMNEVEQVTKDAHVYHNIVDFPDKFETLLGERGVNLSGGQKQRVSIARALIRKPKILILDDCLSAVDTETEEIILRNLDKYQEEYGTAMVIVSHRISSIRNADWVLVVEDGKIVEQGNQQSLLDKNGLFAEMTLKQSLEEQRES